MPIQERLLDSGILGTGFPVAAESKSLLYSVQKYNYLQRNYEHN